MEKGDSIAKYLTKFTQCRDELGSVGVVVKVSLIACLVSSVLGSVWFLDSGASFHMTGDRDLFSDLEDKVLGVHIEMGVMVDTVQLVSVPYPFRGSLVNPLY